MKLVRHEYLVHGEGGKQDFEEEGVGGVGAGQDGVAHQYQPINRTDIKLIKTAKKEKNWQQHHGRHRLPTEDEKKTAHILIFLRFEIVKNSVDLKGYEYQKRRKYIWVHEANVVNPEDYH